jgi:hypothetical protein
MSYNSIEMIDRENGTFFMSNDVGTVICDDATLLSMSHIQVNFETFTLKDSTTDLDILVGDEVGKYSAVQVKLKINTEDVKAIKEPYVQFLNYLIEIHVRDDEGCCEQDLPQFDCTISFTENSKLMQHELSNCHISVFDYDHQSEELILQLTPTHALTRMTV